MADILHTAPQSFLDAYIQTAIWADGEEGEDWSSDDIAPETLDQMARDCEAFYAANQEAIEGAEGVKCGPDFDQVERAAHDFWLTRNGHGAGFWDGDWPEPQASILDSAAKAFGLVSLYRGDDGKIYGG